MRESLIGKSIQMNGSILGFPHLNSFRIQPVDESETRSPFAYFQSEEEEQIGFLVVNTFTFFPNYEMQLSDRDKTELQVAAPQDIAVLGIVSIARPFQHSVVNLLAPLIIHVGKFTGRQIVLPPDSPYKTKTPLFGQVAAQGGEA